MDYALDRFVADIKEAIQATGKVPEPLIELQTPKPNIPADLAFPAFRAARELKVPPPKLAQELAATLRFAPDSLVGAVEAVGPFLNFHIHPERLGIAVLGEIARSAETYGHDAAGQGKTIVIDYSAPNVARRMHIGHIRSTIIGQTLANIFRTRGYRVIGDNHLGDWGKQFGSLLAAIHREGKPQAEGEAALEQLEAMYARYNNAIAEHPELDDEARTWSLRLEQGDPQARELWQWCVDLTLHANQPNYDRLGVAFDHAYGESFYEHMLSGVIQEALDSDVAYRDEDGSVVVDKMDKLPKFVLQRNDGGTLYMTRDVATILFRLKEFDPERIIYAVGAPQELHFRQLFALVRAMGYARDVELIHIPFGTIFDSYGNPFSTRKGNMLYLEQLLDDAVQRARDVIEQKNPDLPETEKDEVAAAVGIGAVIYNDLYQDTRRNITLDWERMLATEGNSAAYLQYSHARCCSILRKAQGEVEDWSPEIWQRFEQTLVAQLQSLTHPSEQQLIKHLARLPEAVREATDRYAPFVIADWCYATAREFGVFFENCPVLKAETPDLRTARLVLVAATAQGLRNGLALLGIKAPERM
jgi:arginyl-tRNA synthetase